MKSKLYKYLCNLCKNIFYSNMKNDKCSSCGSRDITQLAPKEEKKKYGEDEDFWLDEADDIEEQDW